MRLFSSSTLWAGLCAAVLAVAPLAEAQPVSESSRAAARKLGEEANALFKSGDYTAALDKYERADALVHVPTLGVRAARCLDKLGRLVEASERYLAVTRMTLKSDAPKVHKEALEQAETERAALLPRIPAVVIEIKGSTEGAEILLDGKSMPSALVGVEQPIDPGSHHVEVRRAGEQSGQSFSLGEGEKKHISVAAPEPARTAEPVAKPAEPAPEPGADTHRSTIFRTSGYVALGIGTAGVVVGTVTGILALTKKRHLDGVCPNHECPPSEWDAADKYDTLRSYSTAGFVIGVIGIGVGTAVLLTTPKPAPERTSRVEPWLGAGPGVASGGLRGRF